MQDRCERSLSSGCRVNVFSPGTEVSSRSVVGSDPAMMHLLSKSSRQFETGRIMVTMWQLTATCCRSSRHIPNVRPHCAAESAQANRCDGRLKAPCTIAQYIKNNCLR
jgi:hypothetical protein